MLEKNLESPLDCKEIHPIHSRGDQPWDFFGRNDAKAETPVLWPPHGKSWLIRKDSDAGRDWGQEKGTTEDEMAGWHHWLDGLESEWTLRAGDRQGGLACCNSWGRKESTWLSDWTELNWTHSMCIGHLLCAKHCTVWLFTVKGSRCTWSQKWLTQFTSLGYVNYLCIARVHITVEATFRQATENWMP